MPAGVVVLFADERLLSSDPSTGTSSSARPTRPRRTAASSRKRVGEGYAAKRRRLGVPGGNRAPFGIVREGQPSMLRSTRRGGRRPPGVRARRRRRRPTGRSAAATGLAKTHVGEILTNPIYAGRLRTGEPAGVAPDRRSGALVERPDRCASCADPDAGPDRQAPLRARACAPRLRAVPLRRRRTLPAHGSACEAFKAARPRTSSATARSTRASGATPTRSWYEDAIGALLGSRARRRLDDHRGDPPRRGAGSGDGSPWRGSSREREGGAALAKDRGPRAWRRRWRGSTPRRRRRRSSRRRIPTAAEVAPTWILPDLWADLGTRAARRSRRRCSSGSMSWVATDYTLTLTPPNWGWDAAFRAGVDAVKDRSFGRGERI